MILFKDGIGNLKNLTEDEKDRIVKLLDELGLGYDVKKNNNNFYVDQIYFGSNTYNIKIYRR